MDDKRTTVRDVAKEANVSITTVSRFLNQDYGSMSEATKLRIAKAVQKLGYNNPRAKSRRCVALVLPNVRDPFFAGMVEAVERKLESMGISMQLCLTEDSFEKEEKIIRSLIWPDITGLLYMSTVTAKENCYEILKTACKPFVVMDSYLSEYNAPAMVFSNGVYGMYEATKYLVEMGHRDIAYLSGIRYGMFEHHRYQGYVNAMLDSGLKVNTELVRFGSYEVEAGLQAFESLRTSNKHFTAIICENDQLAAGVYKGCLRAGLKIPEDISVVGYNNSNISTMLEPPLTTVDQQLDVIVEYAVDMLVKQLGDKPIIDRTIRVPPRVVLRSSVADINASADQGEI